MSGLSLPGLHFPRHTAEDHMFCETFSKTKDASVLEILESHVSLCKYITPTYCLHFIGATHSKTTEKASMHLHQQSAIRPEYVLHLCGLILACSKRNMLLLY